MDFALRTIRILHLVCMAGILVAALAGEAVAPPRSKESDVIAFLLGAVAIADLGFGFSLRKSMLGAPTEQLQRNPDDEAALRPWRDAQVVSFVFAEAVGLFGLAVRVMTGSREFALPFYVVGLAVLVLWTPRRP